ncbi:MAG: hypothetical protein JSV03_04660 [Planctomycetota bacterium]|nr:MAG: hypothetical protein JSV03_04660 [Planctomycetota bacterium]
MRSIAFTLLVMTVCMGQVCAPPGGGDGATGNGDIPDNTDGNNDVVNWDLPDLPSLAEEQAAIAPTITGMKTALAAGDTAAAARWLVPESRDAYQASFAQTPELMSLLATALESAQLMMVSEDDRANDNTSRRIGDVEIEYDGIVFHATVVKVDGTWLFVKL